MAWPGHRHPAAPTTGHPCGPPVVRRCHRYRARCRCRCCRRGGRRQCTTRHRPTCDRGAAWSVRRTRLGGGRRGRHRRCRGADPHRRRGGWCGAGGCRARPRRCRGLPWLPWARSDPVHQRGWAGGRPRSLALLPLTAALGAAPSRCRRRRPPWRRRRPKARRCFCWRPGWRAAAVRHRRGCPPRQRAWRRGHPVCSPARAGGAGAKASRLRRRPAHRAWQGRGGGAPRAAGGGGAAAHPPSGS